MTDAVAAQAWRAYPHTYAHRMTKGVYETPPHVKLMSTTVVEMLDAGGGLLLIELPPRHSKSETVSRKLPEWFLTNYAPEKHVVLASYGASLAIDNGRIVRNALKEHGPYFGVGIAGDSAANDRWHTDRGGSCTSVGVGGALTGFGGHLLIVDDPIKDAEEAESEIMRLKVINWFQSVLWTRREPGALVIVMATRWHEGDLIGWILDHPELGKMARRIRLPALAEEHDVLGRKLGEPLWPSHITMRQLDSARKGLGERWWNAMFQQRPSNAEGAEIKRSWWRYYDDLPVHVDALEMRILTVDAAFKDSDNSDYVVIQAWGIYGARRYGLDQIRERMGFVATVRYVREMTLKWKPSAVLIEAKANGDAIIDTLWREGVHGLIPVTPKASKIARVRAASPQIEAGNVELPRARWAEELVEEAAAFPLGKHDDMVDACSQMLNWLGDMKRTPVHELQSGDNRWVSPDIVREREQADPFANVLAKVRRAI